MAANLFEVPDGTLVAVPMINSEATVEPAPASPVQVAVSLAATFSNPRVTYEHCRSAGMRYGSHCSVRGWLCRTDVIKYDNG